MRPDAAAARGSSPLTRGKRLLVLDRIAARRLIPAHAGKTPCRAPSSLALRAHPRSRGENPRTAASAGYCAGSSPLTRGKHGGGRGLSRPVGLIPAHAGKTALTSEKSAWFPAHPRSRGENSAKGTNGEPAEGSSPLTRGKRSVRASPSPPSGLIPAHAGKTSSCRRHPAS